VKDIVLVAFMVELVTNSQYWWRCIFFLIVIRKNKQVKLSTIKDVVKHYLFVVVGGGGTRMIENLLEMQVTKMHEYGTDFIGSGQAKRLLFQKRSGKNIVFKKKIRENLYFLLKSQGNFFKQSV